MKVSDFGEFNLINKIKNNSVNSSGVIKGIGDDAAVLEAGVGQNLLVSSDMLIEGKHFLKEKISPFELGHKSLAVNLSDIAAMGGKPRYALLSTGWPKDLEVSYVEEFYQGFKELAKKYGVNLVGGDTVNSPQIIIDVTILGESEAGRAVLRSGAQPGDIVAVTETLGNSGAGLACILKNIKGEDKLELETINWAIKHHLKPEPRVEAGQLLSRLGATAMIDVSDGLASEINHICKKSKVKATIAKERIPLSKELKQLSKLIEKEDPYNWALYGGEDYELLATLPANRFQGIKEVFENQTGLSLTKIGTIDEGTEEHLVHIVDQSGRKAILKSKGFNHFSS